MPKKSAISLQIKYIPLCHKDYEHFVRSPSWYKNDSGGEGVAKIIYITCAESGDTS